MILISMSINLINVRYYYANYLPKDAIGYLFDV